MGQGGPLLPSFPSFARLSMDEGRFIGVGRAKGSETPVLGGGKCSATPAGQAFHLETKFTSVEGAKCPGTLTHTLVEGAISSGTLTLEVDIGTCILDEGEK
jgi:hypothetical protein